ncbi:MgtC/SapB family protein [Paraburkholderia lycopersici]|uniref:Protein MgtC n=1 Tax=Paraburkholderia lycopersici TaxID=416944 RepID=A0A1G7D035_9BURK|nr:MgtC/SapB family protein [Paraburkholderia lycopersici]SDE45064.1 putative Mg2+ transporter-C (MgtC) family protein [Paraburkholderia lycopersici]
MRIAVTYCEATPILIYPPHEPDALIVSWPDFAARLAVAIVAGALIGLNRGETGNAAGLRTTMLVCLAMLQVNVLLLQHGKAQDSFITLDLMRLPLGILSGVGFIGAGSILRKDGLVQGVTTAATMWYVTVVGLCAGGGQYVLAIAGTLLGLVVLQTLDHLEDFLPRGRRAYVTLGHDAGDDARKLLDDALSGRRCRVVLRGVTHHTAETASHQRLDALFEVRWRARPDDDAMEAALSALVACMHEEASWSNER